MENSTTGQKNRGQIFFDSPDNERKKIYELDVYILSEKLSDLIWKGYDNWPEKVKQDIGFSIIIAVDNITANLARGYGCYTIAERKLFYHYARSAFEETKACFWKLVQQSIIKEDEMQAYEKILDELGPRLNSFIKKTK